MCRWVLGVGSVGLVIGLATYGYNIIRALGIKLSLVTASRGFAIELGSAMTVLVASNYGLPVSTTHCQVGSTIGVGSLEGSSGVNWVLFVRMFAGWVMTLFVAGGVSALFCAILAFTPSSQMSEQIRCDFLPVITLPARQKTLTCHHHEYLSRANVFRPNFVLLVTSSEFYLADILVRSPQIVVFYYKRKFNSMSYNSLHLVCCASTPSFLPQHMSNVQPMYRLGRQENLFSFVITRNICTIIVSR